MQTTTKQKEATVITMKETSPQIQDKQKKKKAEQEKGVDANEGSAPTKHRLKKTSQVKKKMLTTYILEK